MKNLKSPKKDNISLKTIAISRQSKQRLKRLGILALLIIVVIFAPYFAKTTIMGDGNDPMPITWFIGLLMVVVGGCIGTIIIFFIVRIIEWIWYGR